MRAAFLGLGRMGRPMAANLSRHAETLTVWNRTRAKADAFAVEAGGDVRVAATPDAAAAGADVVVSMVADDAAAERVHLGPDGTLAADPAPTVVVESGTLAPGTIERIAAAAAERGIGFVDAPVSGSVDAATNASLVLLVGGSDDDVARARPALHALGRRVVHLGGPGRGALAKLLVNGVLFSLNQAVAEAMALADAGGLDVPAFYDALADSAAGAPMLGYRRAQYLDRDAPLTFTVALAAKDMGLLADEAERVGTPAAQARLVLDQLRAAIDDGYGGDDMAALAWRARASARNGRKA
jgi:3-hydroxyisobutyrate dehydrogenase-like beta-hydroxyacid dehydrogenase